MKSLRRYINAVDDKIIVSTLYMSVSVAPEEKLITVRFAMLRHYQPYNHHERHAALSFRRRARRADRALQHYYHPLGTESILLLPLLHNFRDSVPDLDTSTLNLLLAETGSKENLDSGLRLPAIVLLTLRGAQLRRKGAQPRHEDATRKAVIDHLHHDLLLVVARQALLLHHVVLQHQQLDGVLGRGRAPHEVGARVQLLAQRADVLQQRGAQPLALLALRDGDGVAGRDGEDGRQRRRERVRGRRDALVLDDVGRAGAEPAAANKRPRQRPDDHVDFVGVDAARVGQAGAARSQHAVR